MTQTRKHAELELSILGKTTPDAVVLPFKNELLALCEAFGQSGQSGGSAPFVAIALAETLKKLCLQDPISPVTGHADEWGEVAPGVRQNMRCSALFIDVNDSADKAYFLDAIIWKDVDGESAFTGTVYKDARAKEEVRSRQFVRFPFTPKKFYVDVVRVNISKEAAEHLGINYYDDGKWCYYYSIRDAAQLEKVWRYYERPQ